MALLLWGLLYYYFVVLVIKPEASHMLGKHFITELQPQLMNGLIALH